MFYVPLSQSGFSNESCDIASTQEKPMESQQTTAPISYSEPNSVPPSRREQNTDLTIDNDSDKQATDKEGSRLALVHTTREKII
jgi:hypothetical protein